MNVPILTMHVSGADLGGLRERARQVAELFRLDRLQCTRLLTAVSEIARNTVQYAGEGTAAFSFGADATGHQQLSVRIVDSGPGIEDLSAVLAGKPNARGQVPLGIAGARRLVDRLNIEPNPGGGTAVTITMKLPRSAPPLSSGEIAVLVGRLSDQAPRTPLQGAEEASRELVAKLEQLRHRQLDLQLADERKNELLATVAHELRNPLGTLQMTLDLICHKGGVMAPAELLSRCEVMTRQTRQLARLVEDLLDVSRVARGKVELVRQAAEVNMLVTQAVEMTGAATKARAHDVTVKLNDGDLWIHADATRLKQVLCNLIQNAARYTPERGHIDISVRREAAYAVVVVADNGIGIAPQALPHIFELFVQGQAGSAGSTAGLGVGLTLVQRLTEDHGGTVAAASGGLGLGSQVTGTLPLASVEPSQPPVLH